MRISIFLAIAGLCSAISAFELVGDEAREHARDIKLGSNAAILEARGKDSDELKDTSSRMKMNTDTLTIVVGVPKGPTSQSLEKASRLAGGVVGDALHNVAELVQELKKKVNKSREVTVSQKTFMGVIHPQTKSNGQYALCGIYDKPYTARDDKWEPCYKNFYCPKTRDTTRLGGIYEYKGTSSAPFCEQKCICFAGYMSQSLGWYDEPSKDVESPVEEEDGYYKWRGAINDI